MYPQIRKIPLVKLDKFLLLALAIILALHDSHLSPAPIELGQLVAKISRQDFWIWGIVNAAGLALVFMRIIGPEGAAAYNFITNFFPLMNSMRMFGYRSTSFSFGSKEIPNQNMNTKDI